MYSIVYTTVGNEKEAHKIARKLVDEKLAACVNMHPVDSVYTWNGQTETQKEIALSIKTVNSKVDEVTQCIKSMHSYDLPAIISWNIKGEETYLKWISDSTRS